MSNRDWHVDSASNSRPVPQLAPPDAIAPYRLYRFLTQLEDILIAQDDDEQRLQAIRPLVRRFLNQSPWMLLQCPSPDPQRGWAVTQLYDETDYPLTVQLVSWNPGQVSPIHNHAAWGLVALLDGEECNRFWQPQAEGMPMVMQGEILLQPGDLITFMPEAIHQVEALGEEPVLSFNLYGETNYETRFEYNAETSQAKLF